jgi:methylated-DNA-[protein]-cysteine S-methyltransferase
MTFYTMSIDSPLGALRLFAGDDALVGLYMPDQPAPFHHASDGAGHPVLERAREQLAAYFAGTRRFFELPVDPRGTDFQRSVWRALGAIPFGATRSYAELATAVGRPSASRAVGGANGRNPISVIVPCHRVIGADGALTGYAGGLSRKEWLLRHERSHAA